MSATPANNTTPAVVAPPKKKVVIKKKITTETAPAPAPVPVPAPVKRKGVVVKPGSKVPKSGAVKKVRARAPRAGFSQKALKTVLNLSGIFAIRREKKSDSKYFAEVEAIMDRPLNEIARRIILYVLHRKAREGKSMKGPDGEKKERAVLVDLDDVRHAIKSVLKMNIAGDSDKAKR
jgi:hypothetical protein